MKPSKKQLKKTALSAAQKKKQFKKREWKRFGRFSIILAVLISIGGFALANFKNNYEISHNLKDIGNGVPVVVQIHDTGCPTCQKLRRNAEAAIDKLDKPLLLRIADIGTPEGRRLQKKHNVPHVTLLLFDKKGELKNVLSGLKDAEDLEKSFKAHLSRHG